jgi:glutamine synthetase
MLAAGLEGIEKRYELPKPVQENINELSVVEREKRGIGTLPADLFEALNLTAKSRLVRKALGEHTFDAFIKNKLIEWDQYRSQVTPFELERYLPVL